MKKNRFLSVLLSLTLALGLMAAMCVTAFAANDEYTITWLDDDGTVLGTSTVTAGTVPTFGDPTKADTVQYFYRFTGWTPTVVAATEDASYTATYEEFERNVEIIGSMCYIDGERAKGAGLVKIEDDIYYVKQNGAISDSRSIFIGSAKANGLVPAGRYEFDADKRLVAKNGIVDNYYYENNVIAKGKGLVEIDGGYYYVKENGAIYKGSSLYIGAEKANDLVPAGRYDFDEGGRLIAKNGIINDRYYVDNTLAKGMGLIEIDGDYYYVKQSGAISKNSSVFIGSAKANGLLPAGRYEFDENGKMILSD